MIQKVIQPPGRTLNGSAGTFTAPIKATQLQSLYRNYYDVWQLKLLRHIHFTEREPTPTVIQWTNKQPIRRHFKWQPFQLRICSVGGGVA